jgi:hypothetical protein
MKLRPIATSSSGKLGIMEHCIPASRRRQSAAKCVRVLANGSVIYSAPMTKSRSFRCLVTSFMPAFSQSVAVLLCAIIPITAFAAENGYKVVYDGGSIQDVKTGSDLRLFIESDRIRFTKDKKELITIPASSVTEISYGQDVHRRVGAAIGLAVISFGIGALMALTKSKKHFVGLTWADGERKGGFAIQCDKSDYRGVLAGIEGITGKKAGDSEALTVKN